MEAYIHDNLQKIEDATANRNDYHYVPYHSGTQWLMVYYTHQPTWNRSSGYQNVATYYHKLGDGWYIVMHFMSPV